MSEMYQGSSGPPKQYRLVVTDANGFDFSTGGLTAVIRVCRPDGVWVDWAATITAVSPGLGYLTHNMSTSDIPKGGRHVLYGRVTDGSNNVYDTQRVEEYFPNQFEVQT